MARPEFIGPGATAALGVLFVVLALVMRNKSDASTKEVARRSRQRVMGAFWGLVMIGLGVSRLAAPRRTPEAEVREYRPAISSWLPVETTDGVLRVMMPGQPRFEREKFVGELGLTNQVRAQVSVDSGRFSFSEMEKRYIDTELRIDAEEYLDALVDATVKKSGGRATKTLAIELGSLTGREFNIVHPKGYTVTSWILLAGRALYQLNAVAPTAMAESPVIREFLSYVSVNEYALKAERKPPVFERKQKAER